MVTGFLFILTMFISVPIILVGAMVETLLGKTTPRGGGRKKRRREISQEDYNYYNTLHTLYMQEQRIV